MFVYGLKSVWIPWLWPTFNQVFLMVFLSAWPDGSYVITRCPQPRFFGTRRTAKALAGFGATATEAWAQHRGALREFGLSRGRPLTVETLEEAVACYRAAAPTFRRAMLRTVLLVLPLGLAAWALLAWANFAR